MPAGKVDADLEGRLGQLRERHGSTVKIEEIAEVVTSLLASLTGDLSAADLEIFSELESLATYIRTAKSEIAALRPDEVKDEYLPKATDELDAIVEATAEATNAIMDATEMIEDVSGRIGGADSEKLGEATTKIYEACSFQDITGQRITKVVKALKHIEEKIDALVAAFGSDIDKVKREGTPSPEPDEKKEIVDEDLLHGPQLKGQGRSQEEIDALLASFD
jgi:chemotaxis protein CheZ